MLGSRRVLDRMGKTLSGKYSMRESHRLGFGNHCERHAELLNRIVSVGTEQCETRQVSRSMNKNLRSEKKEVLLGCV